MNRKRTLYLPRSSFERADDIILRRMEEGAEKWALRAFRREEETSVTETILQRLCFNWSSKLVMYHPTGFSTKNRRFTEKRERLAAFM